MPFLRLISLTVLLGTAVACNGGCAGTITNPGAIETIPMVPVEPEVQHRIAIHEMAHAVASRILFGEGDVDSIHIHAERCAPQDYDTEYCCDLIPRPHFGSIDRSDDLFSGGLEHARKKTVVYLVGPVADHLLNGIAANSYDGVDSTNVDTQIETVHRALQARAQNAIHSRGGNPRAERELRTWTPEKERARATAMAETIVRENEGAIRELAQRLMDIPPVHGSRIMDGETFEEYVRALKLVDPAVKLRKKAPKRK